MAGNTLAEQNKALVANFVADIWNAKQFDKVADYVQHNPDLPNGRTALEGFLKSYYAQNMPTGEFSIARQVEHWDVKEPVPESSANGNPVV
jgi:predicted SnoaL-like aldol condensation-catalyzing enzyme